MLAEPLPSSPCLPPPLPSSSSSHLQGGAGGSRLPGTLQGNISTASSADLELGGLRGYEQKDSML